MRWRVKRRTSCSARTFFVVAKSPLDRIMKFTTERGWRNLQLLSSANNTYNRDYHAESEKGDQLPALNVFVKRDGAIHHFYNTELCMRRARRGRMVVTSIRLAALELV